MYFDTATHENIIFTAQKTHHRRESFETNEAVMHNKNYQKNFRSYQGHLNRWDKKEVFMLASVDEAYPTDCKLGDMPVPAEEEDSIEFETAWDDVNGGDLPLDLVKKERMEEVDFMNKRRMWDFKPIALLLPKRKH